MTSSVTECTARPRSACDRIPRTWPCRPACVVEHSGRSGGVVYVVRDGIARRTEVKLGGDNGTYAEIRSGIKPDDSIVVPSGTPLEDGMPVTVDPPPAAG